jgi:hypothetical protein
MNKIMNPNPQVFNRHGGQTFLIVKRTEESVPNSLMDLLQENQYSHKNVALHYWQFLLIKALWL